MTNTTNTTYRTNDEIRAAAHAANEEVFAKIATDPNQHDGCTQRLAGTLRYLNRKLTDRVFRAQWVAGESGLHYHLVEDYLGLEDRARRGIACTASGLPGATHLPYRALIAYVDALEYALGFDGKVTP